VCAGRECRALWRKLAYRNSTNGSNSNNNNNDATASSNDVQQNAGSSGGEEETRRDGDEMDVQDEKVNPPFIPTTTTTL
jgi:hypothetical protein